MSKQFKDTKFGQFLNKAGAVVPDVLNVGGKVLTGNISGAIADVGTLLKGEAPNNPEAQKLLQEFELAQMDFEKEMYALEVQDRDSARKREAEYVKVGKTDWMMVVTGVCGLVAFFVVIYAVIYIPNMQENDLFIHLLGMIEGVVVSNIFAYYYGTSKSSHDKDEKIGH
jgi:hypothetical protein